MLVVMGDFFIYALTAIIGITAMAAVAALVVGFLMVFI